MIDFLKAYFIELAVFSFIGALVLFLLFGFLSEYLKEMKKEGRDEARRS